MSEDGGQGGAVVPPDPLLGEVLGNWKIVKELGRGGMGAVYLAEHTMIGKKAAIKVLLPRFSTDKDIVQRFFNEAKSAAMIQHGGIVEVFDFGMHASGSAYLVMELLAGESLTARLKREGVLPLPLIVAIVRQVAAAVGAAHAQQIVHRDLKPDNVYLLPDEEMPHGLRVKVLDFGIAKLADEGQPDEVKTQAGQMLGTPWYMSPEQCKGAGEVDARSDVYSLGCIIYQMATGTVPFDEQGTGALIAAHIYEDPPPPRTIDASLAPALEAVILKSLAKEPGARQQSMDQLVDELEACLVATENAASAEAAPARKDAPGEPVAAPKPAATAAPTGPSGPAPETRVSTAPAAPAARTVAGLVAANRTLFLVAGGALVAGGIIAVIAMSGGKKASAPGAALPPADAAPAPAPDAPPPPPTSCDQGDFADCAVQAARAETGDGVPRDLARAQALWRTACEGGVATACAPAGQRLVAQASKPGDATAAFALWKRGCDAGDADACLRTAAAYEAGLGVERDASRAFALLLEQCDKQRADACAELAVLYRRGRGVAVDVARAGALALRACDAGSGAGCALLGELYAIGQGVPPDQAKAAAAFDKGCAAGHAGACVSGGKVERALELTAEACALGDAAGCGDNARARLGQRAVPRDFLPACRLGDLRACAFAGLDVENPDRLALLADTCAAGEPNACVILARAVRGDDAERALSLFEEACNRGGDQGCLELAEAYAGGEDVDKDPGRANQLFRKGCDAGDGEACRALAERLATGSGGRKDERRARTVAERACAIDARDCDLAARFAATGVGGATDLARAKELYARACAAGAADACPLRENPLPAPDAGVPPDAGTAP